MPTPHELEVAKRQDVLRRHGNDFYVQEVVELMDSDDTDAGEEDLPRDVRAGEEARLHLGKPQRRRIEIPQVEGGPSGGKRSRRIHHRNLSISMKEDRGSNSHQGGDGDRELPPGRGSPRHEKPLRPEGFSLRGRGG